MSVVNLVEILITLILFRSTSDLTWNGNRRWKYIPAFYYAVVLLSCILTVPGLQVHSERGRHFLKVLGIEGVGAGPDGAGPWADGRYELVILVLAYLQYLNFDNMRFVFVLHYAQRHAIAVAKRSALNVDLRRRMMKVLCDPKLFLL